MNAIAQLRPDNAGSPDPALLWAAVEALPESLAIAASGLIIYANPAWRGMFECPDPDPLQGMPLEDRVPIGRLLVRHRGRVARGWRNWPRGAVRLHPPGRHAPASRAGAGGFSICAAANFKSCYTRDVSRQKQLERQLREAQTFEAVGRLVGGVAHDFNNLLTGIMLYCDLLIGELEKNSRPYRHVQEMRMAGEHGAALVRQLLAVAHPRPEEAREFALNEVVAGIEDLLIRLLGENIVLQTSLAADLGAVRMDPSQVQQILLNLVLNARDAMPDGGQITIATRNCNVGVPDLKLPGEPWVVLSVADTGDGMDAETLDRAFEPFFTTKQPGRGNGLGLATARRLARQQGGTIVAESQPGKGTRVSVRLPRVQPDAPSNSKVEVIS